MSIFLDKVGDTPSLRILEYFLESRGSDHAISDVIESVEMSRSTFYAAWPLLLKNEYIVLSRTVGKTRLYRLNVKNVYAQLFLNLFDTALRDEKKRIRA